MTAQRRVTASDVRDALRAAFLYQLAIVLFVLFSTVYDSVELWVAILVEILVLIAAFGYTALIGSRPAYDR